MSGNSETCRTSVVHTVHGAVHAASAANFAIGTVVGACCMVQVLA